ncbi:hypothetical protein ACHMW6_02540 [Pseudoduganella sp. UC29_106]|uniref:hypothetical protein n=1 Tax=Pseudoduganella sp. UC29_106 TaxID=3374553 RepID=UPI003756D668
MPKNKKPVPRKSSTPPQEKEEVLSQALSELALTVAEQEYEDMSEMSWTSTARSSAT